MSEGTNSINNSRVMLEITASALHTCGRRTYEPRLKPPLLLHTCHPTNAGMLQFHLAWLPDTFKWDRGFQGLITETLEGILVTATAEGCLAAFA